MATEAPNLYRILGIRKNATAAAIKSAYRKLSKRHHPDIGGDPATFAKLAMAYKVLSSPETRAHYDATGEIPETDRTAGEAFNALADLVNQLVQNLIERGYDALPGNLAEQVQKHAADKLAELRGELAKLDKCAQLYQDIEDRMSRASDPETPDIVAGIIGQRRLQDAERRQVLERALSVWTKAEEIAAGMACDWDAKDAPGRTYSISWNPNVGTFSSTTGY